MPRLLFFNLPISKGSKHAFKFYMEAMDQYKKTYALEPLYGVAYRVTYCYDKLELEELSE